MHSHLPTCSVEAINRTVFTVTPVGSLIYIVRRVLKNLYPSSESSLKSLRMLPAGRSPYCPSTPTFVSGTLYTYLHCTVSRNILKRWWSLATGSSDAANHALQQLVHLHIPRLALPHFFSCRCRMR